MIVLIMSYHNVKQQKLIVITTPMHLVCNLIHDCKQSCSAPSWTWTSDVTPGTSNPVVAAGTFTAHGQPGCTDLRTIMLGHGLGLPTRTRGGGRYRTVPG